MPKRSCGVYLQCTSDEALEREMVQIVLVRDLFLEKLVHVSGEVKDRLRPLNEESTLETLSLLTAVRNATIDLILQIEQWQKKYTQIKRPTINGGDYMMRLLKHVEFANTLAIKRTFNFQIGRGNLFMLPLINAKSMPPVKVTDKIKAHVDAFSGPDISRLTAAIAILNRSLPKKLLADIMPLEHWVASRWVPSLIVCSYFLKEDENIKLPKIKGKLHADTGNSRIVTSPPQGHIEKGMPISEGPETLPRLQRMNSDISVLSQLSEVSGKSGVSVRPVPSGEPSGRQNSFDSAATPVSKKTEALEAPPAAVPARNFNTLAMRNWFIAETCGTLPKETTDIAIELDDASES